MKSRRIWATLIICIMMLNAFGAVAEGSVKEKNTEGLYYQGGVVDRGYAGGIAPFSVEPALELGYALANAPYIVLNADTVWEVVVSGGTEPYACEAVLACQTDLSLDPFADLWSVPDYFDLTDDTFNYVFTEAGRYFWEFTVTDATGQYLTFQTRIYETYTAEDETDPTTVAGKVNSIIASEITDSMSDYSRALALHDWLIYNANYDYTFTNYDAAGVLLYGSGVCDSYARAYLMLMTAAGVDCMIVTGTAGSDADSANWGSHAWNMVKLGDSWYHVDCTWDDPNTGGYECHDYFCVSDETLAADHLWNTPDNVVFSDGGLVPAAEGGEYESAGEASGGCDFTFATIDEFDAAFDAEVAAGNHRAKTIGLYTGSEAVSDVYTAFKTWGSAQMQELANQGLVTGGGYGYSGKLFTYRLTWTDPDDYIRIDETKLMLSVGETAEVAPSDYSPAANVFTWISSDPSVATVTSAYSEDSGLTAAITGVSAGTTVITATSADGLSDSIAVTVLGAYQPDFNLSMTETESAFSLSWDLIPGATEYQVMLAANGAETCLATVTGGVYDVASSELANNPLSELWIAAVRRVGGTVAATYTSEKLAVTGELSFDAVLPEGVTAIESEAFAGSASLVSVYIPDGAETIGAGAFSSCAGLTAIRIPASVTSISDDAFVGCALRYLQTTKGSHAAEWFEKNMEGVTIIYE